MSVSRGTSGWRSWLDRDILCFSAEKVGVKLSSEQTDFLLEYLELLRKWNRKINLIGPGPPEEQVILHLVDSLSALPHLGAEPNRLLDLGSGAGLPGLVLAVLRPGLQVSLAESRSKKAAFLKEAVRRLGLVKTVRAVGRADPRKDGIPKGFFDLVTFRGLGKLSEVLPLAKPYLEPGGRVLAYKGPKGFEEADEVRDSLKEWGFELSKIIELTLPLLEQRRILLTFSCL